MRTYFPEQIVYESFLRALVLTGLLLVGIGTGGIKPCVATFGGDQFKLPEQKKQSLLFFSIFYWAVNLGSLCSMLLTPQLRASVSCLGQDYCYPLAFGVPAVLMFVAIGTHFTYTMKRTYRPFQRGFSYWSHFQHVQN